MEGSMASRTLQLNPFQRFRRRVDVYTISTLITIIHVGLQLHLEQQITSYLLFVFQICILSVILSDISRRMFVNHQLG